MSNQKTLNKFTGMYSLSKTLRFELIPQNDTLQNIQRNGLITKDKSRAENYKKMKETLDEYHRYFIESALKNVKLTKLNEYMELYCADGETKKSDKFKVDFDKIKSELRKEIVSCFKKDDIKDTFEILNKKELIKEELEKWIEAECKDCYFNPDFKTFTTYFRGYNENRMNMYSADEKSTAISYRIVNENLPKFIDNIKIFNKVSQTQIAEKFDDLYKGIGKYLNVSSINEVFLLENFNRTLTQSQINIYNYVIGGLSGESGTKIQGLNEYINLFNQSQADKNARLPKLKQLYKQILSPSQDISFLPEAFETPQELLDGISYFFNHNLLNNEIINASESVNIFEEIQNTLFNLNRYNLDKVYLHNDSSISNISQKVFGDYSFIREAISKYYDMRINPNYQIQYEKTSNKEKKQKEKEKFTKQSYLSIKALQEAVDIHIKTFENNEDIEDNSLIHKGYSPTCIADYFKNYFYSEEPNENGKKFDFISNIMARYSCVKGLLNTDFKEKELSQIQKDNLKVFLDSILGMLRFVKPLYLKNSDEYSADDMFYSTFTSVFERLSEFTKLYDKVRNFITKKPFNTEKFKLNFENPTLAEGWDVNKETDYSCVLFKKNNDYYLGVLKDKKVFKDIENNNSLLAAKNEASYSKIVYKQISQASKYISGKQILPQNPPTEIKNILKKKKQDSSSLTEEEIIKFIDYCQNDFLKNYNCLKNSNGKAYFNFEFKKPKDYNSLKEFFTDVENQAYSITYIGIKETYINELVSNDKLYLFKIYNKDFSSYSKGSPNLHTLYWKALFDEKNLKDVKYKLNGQAEIFYREKSIEYTQDKMQIGHHYEELKSKFEYPIIKDKRYAVDKFMLHVPITLNFKSDNKTNVNKDVLEFLKNNPDVNIIGIDRGERNLLYISLIDQKGNVISDEKGDPIQYSLNKIVNEYSKNGEIIPKAVNYRDKLDEMEQKRAKAREDWAVIENIKELKEGYLSQVVHLVSKLMVKYNAIIVMEDLNFGFKRGRFKVEKQVYQKFEKMLIDKLNYLVFKDTESTEAGGIYKALQLTSKFESFEKLGKQCGFIFYVPAWNTSKIDPVTGFVDFLKPKYNSVKESKSFFEKFDRISFNKEKNYFEFAFDYNNFTSQAQGTRSQWIVCSYGDERYTYNKTLNNNRGGYEKWNVTKKIKELLGEYGINYENGNDIRDQIENISEAKFFAKLIKCLNVLLALRYSSAEEKKDFILSPVANEDGVFFNSENADNTMPKDADANGAYHIAKKGLWVLKEINKTEDLSKIKLAISNKEWLNFVQDKKYLEN